MVKNKEYKMLKEIFEQPEIIKKLVKQHLNKNNQVIFSAEAGSLDKLKKIERIIFLGCGTSYHAAIYGNYLAEELLCWPCEFEFADEFIARPAVIEKNIAVVIISQSGETADAIKAAAKARGKKAVVIAVTNNSLSQLAKKADIVLATAAGQEEAIAATKTFTAQLFMLLLLVLYLAQRHKIFGLKVKKLAAEIKNLSAKMNKVLKNAAAMKKIILAYEKSADFAVLGEEWNYPIALEGALKLTETNAMAVEGFPTGEFKHGPLAMVKKKFPVIFIAPNDSVYEINVSLMVAVKNAGGRIILITTAGKKQKLADRIIYIPKITEQLYPFLTVIPLQLIAYYLAISKGINVDQPKNLSKYVK